MKNFLTAFVLLFATVLSNANNIHNNELNEKIKSEIKFNNRTMAEEESFVPAYGDEDIIEYYDSEGDESWNDRDQYEKNNSISTAKKINLQETISGTIHKSFWKYLFPRIVDEDYYYLNVFGDGTLNITLSVPSSVDYNLALIKYDNELNATYSSADTLTVSSNEGNGISESITYSVTPGTYYIAVFADTSADYSSVPYVLSTNINYNLIDSVSIPKYRFNKGAKGAVWKSDLTPFGKLVHKIDESANLECTIPAPIFEELDNDGIVDSVIYLWSGEWRLSIADFIKDCKDRLEETYQRNLDIQLTFRYVTEGVSVVGNALQLVVKVPALVVVGEVLCGVSDLATAVVPLLFPEVWDTTIGELVDYLETLYNALNCTIESGDNEVIAIECKYIINNNRLYYYPCIKNDYDFNSTYITQYNQSAKTYGKIYPLVDFEDLSNYYNYGILSDSQDINTGGNTLITLDSLKTFDIEHQGQYYWYKFVAPNSGTYNFYSTGSNADTYGELFSSIVVGDSTTGLLDYDDDSGEYEHFLINYELIKNQVVYIRVRGYNWSACGAATLDVAMAQHEHDYTESYTSLNAFNHSCECSCGATTTEPHRFQTFKNGHRCIDCLYFTTGPVITPGFENVNDEEEE